MTNRPDGKLQVHLAGAATCSRWRETGVARIPRATPFYFRAAGSHRRHPRCAEITGKGEPDKSPIQRKE